MTQLLFNRLNLWASINKCQAGGQRRRGCVEQIMNIRLLYKKVKLYVLFIDFSKAYDKVPRHKLIHVLKSLGCGKVMLRATETMYECTKNVMRAAVVTATAGVRQGAPSSCLLFIIYIDQMVKMLRREIGEDGFLGTLHSLLLMDDAVIMDGYLARYMCVRKLDVVRRYCDEYGMTMNDKNVIGGKTLYL